MNRRRAPRPALLTGTSSEYLGRRPLPRLVRERRVVVVIGPPRVGKSRVARRMAGEEFSALDAHLLDQVTVQRVRAGAWPRPMLASRALVVDGPSWLCNRPSVVALLVELAQVRASQDHRTLFCQRDDDGSMQALVSALPSGSSVVVALRFPRGRRSRVRIARRRCLELGLSESMADGADRLDPWTYDAVDEWLRGRAQEDP